MRIAKGHPACARIAAALIGVAFATAAPAQQAEVTVFDLDAALGRLEESLSAVESLRADIVQEKHLSLFTDPIELRGEILFQEPDRVRIDTTSPYESSLIARGDAVAGFEKTEGQWRRLQHGSPEMMRAVTSQIGNWMRGRLRSDDGVFDLSGRGGEQVTVVLTPRDRAFREIISAIEITITEDGTRVAGVTIREPNGDFTAMRFENEAINVHLADDLFRTTGDAPTPLGSAASTDVD
jgi:outer membrane lipoprotein-sorting protein